MEQIKPHAQAQWYAGLGKMANLAGYGLEFYAQHAFGDETKALVTKGLELCQMLAEGAAAARRASVTINQLHAMRAAEPILRPDKLEEIHTRLDQARALFEQILVDIERQRQTTSREDLTKLRVLLADVNRTFVSRAFGALTERDTTPGVSRNL